MWNKATGSGLFLRLDMHVNDHVRAEIIMKFMFNSIRNGVALTHRYVGIDVDVDVNHI